MDNLVSSIRLQGICVDLHASSLYLTQLMPNLIEPHFYARQTLVIRPRSTIGLEVHYLGPILRSSIS
jgi:hypothetical protein